MANFHGRDRDTIKAIADMLWRINYKMTTKSGRKELNRQIRIKWLGRRR